MSMQYNEFHDKTGRLNTARRTRTRFYQSCYFVLQLNNLEHDQMIIQQLGLTYRCICCASSVDLRQMQPTCVRRRLIPDARHL
uniref:Uncharacterized protein n=1 Tax=Rhizophagus irregularis (strain DAOM 181602 / DAOM 197198 / MUCL 43194) TaxID=747089 RepID=U9TD87_RHIID